MFIANLRQSEILDLLRRFQDQQVERAGEEFGASVATQNRP